MASEKTKNIQPNLEAAAWLLKPLKLEATLGYTDQAVAGGIRNWLPRLQQKLIEQADFSEEQAAQMIAPLQGYTEADTNTRKKSIQLVVASYKALAATKSVKTEKKEFAGEKKSQPADKSTQVIKDTTMSIQYLKGVGPKRQKLLQKLGVETVEDLIHYYPRDWQDRTSMQAIGSLKAGETALICGRVKAKGSFNVRRGLNLTKIILEDPSGRIEATWFNQPYIKDRFEVGQTVIAFGKIEFFRQWQVAHPECEIIEELEDEKIHTSRIVPIYKLTEKLNQRVLRQLIYTVLESISNHQPEMLPQAIQKQLKLISSQKALQQIHFPDSEHDLKQARHTLIYEELILQQIAIQRLRQQYQKGISQALNTTGPMLNAFLKALPFELTQAQIKAKHEILNDLQQKKPMHRLLQGDVGSGKTMLALVALLTAIDSGYQAAFMAPTEILAFQHFQSIQKLIEPLGIKAALLTSSLKPKEKKDLYDQLREGTIQIVVGTHALTQDQVVFHSLGVVVIDEQHRFGVEQRQLLRAKGVQPHVLVMTATPIPRTLALTVYGDLDVTVVGELPPGRQPIATQWLKQKQAGTAYRAISQAIQMGRQAYIVFPLIEESEKLDLKALAIEYERLKKHVFPDSRLGLLHGKLKKEEKDEVMQRFKQGDIQILTSTTVIEVGVDVPNATIIVIENAERFGLAALHQLRGRVGRGAFPSTCYLISDPKTEEGKFRMEIMQQVKDGFLLSEKDLALRGPGEFFGMRQHGLPDLKLANLITDADKIEKARKIAEDILTDDPLLNLESNRLLKEAYLKVYLHKEKIAKTG